MTDQMVACRVLKEVENDLRTVIDALITAEPTRLQGVQKLLEQMVTTLGSVEGCCRVNPQPPVREALQGLRSTFGRVRTLSTAALDTVERQSALAGVLPLSAEAMLQIDA